ncbi:MAG: AAA family ATPase [Lachnospiraceae bacterium]|nr:AAA family ATPase [Lachnospiraceae bacterium]
MGTYLNPGNRGFIEIRNGTYVDKTGLIGQINETIGTKEKLICISRPRRFGKSYATQMLCAYYDKTCDSAALFDDLAIAVDERWNGGYRQHLNQYDVIYLDMTNLMGKAQAENMISYIEDSVTEELVLAYPGLKAGNAFDETLIRAVELTGNKFVMIIDEWDAPIREIPELQKTYLKFLRMLFKGSGTTDKIFAAVYMTGILPIKKDGSQSAISDFQEFPVIKPRYFGPYVGFTATEVRELCEEHHCDFAQMRYWYDGYSFRGVGSVYNPNSVMKAIRYHDFDSYWTQTSAAESLAGYVSLDYDGLSGTVAELIGGGRVRVDTKGFANDLVTFRNRDDVLTLLIHLGYLAYEEETGTVRIPNEEIRLEFVKMIRQVKRDDTIRRVRESDQLILDTIQGKEEAVAAQIERIHEEESPLHYHGEQALRSVVKRAYFSYGDEYLLFEEFPSGVGYADILYLPRKYSPLPALLIELKWNQSAEGAIAQIKDRNYPQAIKDFGGDLLLVGISYDKDAPAGQRKHTCCIEKYV